MAFDVFDDDDGVVDHQAGGQRDAEQRQRVDGEAKQLDESKRADERDRYGDCRDDGGAPVFEEDEDDQDNQEDGRAQGRDYIADGFADRVGGIESDLILHAGRKALGKAVELSEAAAVHVEGVGGGELRDTEANRFVPAVVQVGAVVFGAELGVTDIPQADESAIGIALQDDVIELTGFRKTADGADADLELLAGKRGLRTDLSGGDFNVLFLERADHIVGGKGAAGHAHGIEPQTHGVFAFAEDHDVGHAGYALQTVADVDIEVIAHEERGVATVGREDGSAEDEILRALGDGDSDLLHRAGEPSGSSVDAVLDINSGEVGIAVEVERGGDRADPVVVAGGGDVLHAFGAVDLLLQGRGNGGLDGLGAGSGIDSSDTDLRRREVRKLCDGKCRDTDGASENNEQGADGGEYRTMNKKVDHKCSLSRRTSGDRVIGPSGDRKFSR